MKKQYTYDIKIKFNRIGTNKHLLTKSIPYLGSLCKLDMVNIRQNEIQIVAMRTSIIDLKQIFYNHNSSLYNQIIKTLVYYYALQLPYAAIDKISITRKGQLNILEDFEYTSTEFQQPVGKISGSLKFNAEQLEVIFEESEKGRSYLIALSYWIKGMSSHEEDYRFERLWRGFNSLYTFRGSKKSEFECHINLRAFIINNENILEYSKVEINKYSDENLRKTFRWRGLILNDYPTFKNTKAFRDFILRYSDSRVMKLLIETLPYRKEYLKREGFYDEVDVYLKNHHGIKTKSDAELISLLCIKYMYFVRNKLFHGEKIDSDFKLLPNKETRELVKLNSLLSSLMVDLINVNDLE